MNLFIVSNIGQLYQAQALIRKKNLDQNILALLYTNVNTTILDYLHANVDESLFVKKETVLLPNHPNNFSIRKLAKIRLEYEQLFNKYNPEKVFICSFESHYNFIKDIAVEKSVMTVLFEDGTATYKFLIEEDEEEPKLTKRMKRAFRISGNDFKNAFKKLFAAITQLTKASIRTLKRLIAALFTKEQRKNLKASIYPKHLKSAFKTINEFDEVYVTFPEKAKDIFKSKVYNEMISDYSLNEETTEVINRSNTLKKLASNSVVFVNQRYNVPVNLHVNIILSFLSQYYNEDKIFVKFHPKDSTEMKEAFWSGLQNFKLDAEIIDLNIEVPFEAILKVKKPKEVIGISSTSLIYTQKILPTTTTVSCANYYIDNLKQNKVDQKVVDLISYHKRILETLSDIDVK
ncbi:alpha-2,8-polysialyltransferase family protein [Metabacillus arenae]|uniref:Uncharacterized protein n=1 Tax=Metabacillus arenae TaxID=2771434 RepID=A0A926NLP8_9BACI|nr:alpha-2,8-polysialyltransferase family protein [Metabacillus arenae]MBD1383010.1 hypothetical protein [Metabacillus arenae]